MIEHHLQYSDELQKIYLELQSNIELMAKKLAMQPPADLKSKVLASIEEETANNNLPTKDQKSIFSNYGHSLPLHSLHYLFIIKIN